MTPSSEMIDSASVNLELVWPSQLLMALHGSVNLGIHWWAIWGQACPSANWQASLLVLWNNKGQYISSFNYSQCF